MVSVHHFQITTSNLVKRVAQFQGQFGLRILGHRLTNQDEGEEVALYINSVVMVIKAGPVTMATCSDWISDIVLHVPSCKVYDQIKTRAESVKTETHTTGAHSCKGAESNETELETRTHSCNGAEFNETDTHTTRTHSYNSVPEGTGMRIFRIQTPFHSVCHTILNGECNCVKWSSKHQTCFSCLPGFTKCPRLSGHTCLVCKDRFETVCRNIPSDISHVDHVTFACHTNSSESILEWYERCLGFKRFKINASEDENGFIIEGTNGMRMLAMKYWQCSETCITLEREEEGEEGESDDVKPVQLVFAEPLPNSGRNQVQTFLEDNSGPGVQHIAFHTNNIVGVVSCLRSNHVPFITPPPEYYSLFEKISEIEKTDERVELLQHNNILIDFEVYDDPLPKYLMQVFSHPLFDKDTFFLEVIQRCGATGFGAGNITALWKALEIHFKQNKTTTEQKSIY